jgi:hypothetical protein
MPERRRGHRRILARRRRLALAPLNPGPRFWAATDRRKRRRHRLTAICAPSVSGPAAISRRVPANGAAMNGPRQRWQRGALRQWRSRVRPTNSPVSDRASGEAGAPWGPRQRCRARRTGDPTVPNTCIRRARPCYTRGMTAFGRKYSPRSPHRAATRLPALGLTPSERRPDRPPCLAKPRHGCATRWLSRRAVRQRPRPSSGAGSLGAAQSVSYRDGPATCEPTPTRR